MTEIEKDIEELEFSISVGGEPTYVLKGRAAKWAEDLLETKRKYESLKIVLEGVVEGLE